MSAETELLFDTVELCRQLEVFQRDLRSFELQLKSHLRKTYLSDSAVVRPTSTASRVTRHRLGLSGRGLATTSGRKKYPGIQKGSGLCVTSLDAPSARMVPLSQARDQTRRTYRPTPPESNSDSE